ncbi:hypothetical protein FEZ33_00335 [Ruoffia tabacinasalis]|uniref:Uncharacterized protein n=1 Tax=Ruoffia tabacinasalis TaxID=87458 RepID=A0A5R9EH07_9LACT|nr:hypothetical protein [Ruoffia tabacinasalis]TLQ49470.1 hypothetical protein FEZ33_00335 [Ruoffia tabacinasalis]
MKTISILKQFIFRLILTGLGQYAIIEGIRAIDSSNSIIELIPMIPFTAFFSTLINTAIYHFIVYAVNRLTRFSQKLIVTLSIILGLLLLSIVLFIFSDSFLGSFSAYLFFYTLPFLIIETLLYFIRNRKIL